MTRRKPYPPEYDEEPPEDGVMEFIISTAACHTCRKIIGPDHAEDVGYILYADHDNHDTEILGEWTEVEVFEPDWLFDLYEETGRKRNEESWKRPRCQGCGQFVDPDDPDVIDEQISGGPRITDHKDCHRDLNEEQFAKGMASLEAPEGGWRRNSDLDRL